MAFIISKRNFLVHLNGAPSYRIPKGFIGEIPKDVYNSHLVQKNIKAGLILVPASKADKDIQDAEDQAEAKKKNTVKK